MVVNTIRTIIKINNAKNKTMPNQEMFIPLIAITKPSNTKSTKIANVPLMLAYMTSFETFCVAMDRMKPVNTEKTVNNVNFNNGCIGTKTRTIITTNMARM